MAYKVLIISSSPPYKASGIVPMQLLNALKNNGYEVKLLTRFYGKYPENIIAVNGFFLTYWEKFKNKLLHYFNFFNRHKTLSQYHFQEFYQNRNYFTTEKLIKRAGFVPDFVFIFFMTRLLSYKNIYEFNSRFSSKVFFVLMDMAPLTGGCHYTWQCKNYENSCGNCPAFIKKSSSDQSYKNLKYKINYAEKSDFKVLVGTTTTYQKLSNTAVFHNKEIIQGYYIYPDFNLFNPYGSDLKEELNIPSTFKIFLIGAFSNNNYRKGTKQLVDTINKLYDIDAKIFKNVIFLLIGSNSNIGFNENLNIINLGYITDFNKLAKIYHTAHFFISPSIEDAGPTMILQSMMCNTPTISFDIGFAKDLVEEGINGLKCKEIDFEIMSGLIVKAINMDDNDYKFLKKNLNIFFEFVKNNNFGDKVINDFLIHEK